MNIMLACAQGLSTSLLVEKMKKCAADEGKNYKIWAVDQAAIEGELGNFDVVLLGPQVQHIRKRVAAIVGDAAPVAVIKPTDYGRMNAAGILRQAEELCGK
ncbi:MAG: PTS sugar transporter subunit IIB [Lachnospiraceae bacterium]|nr:PTS sugar transporter subunit IIB [Lachnospiraceae bacterium]